MAFFMGQLMKVSKGKVEPKTASAALRDELEN
jgi:Asp-tRNA(Asn)/Glu-tRNA(Gln) amidotransferase B subunit